MVIHAIVMFVLSVLFGPAAASQHAHPQPAAAEGRATTALTAEMVKQLLNGDGMGLAKAAELNQYPGPKHLLEKAEELALTADQRKKIELIHAEMRDTARTLGKQIVEGEEALDAAFRGGGVSEEEVAKRLALIGALQRDLRLVHLRAHLQTKPLLTPAQVKKYYATPATIS